MCVCTVLTNLKISHSARFCIKWLYTYEHNFLPIFGFHPESLNKHLYSHKMASKQQINY